MGNAGALVSSCMYGIAQLPFGQTFIRLLDRTLWIVEKTAQWSLPNHESTTEENGKSFKQMELVRPLPWIFFLPALIMLRMCRSTWNITTIFTGCPKMEPSNMVKFLQKSRRQLRAIKTNAIKAMRQRKSSENLTAKENSQLYNVNRSLLRSIQKALSSFSCLDASKHVQLSPASTRIQVRLNHEMIPTAEEQSENETAIPEPKRKYKDISGDDKLSDDESEEETLITKINRLALENSSDDQDFNPEDVSSSGNDSLFVDSADDEEFSGDEVETLKADLLKDVNAEKPAENNQADFVRYNVDFEDVRCEKSGYGTPRHEDFYSPLSKGQDDVDTAFYSPISSNSVSPEPAIPTFVNDHGIIEAEKSVVQENGESKNDTHNALNSEAAVEKSNGHEKIDSHQNQAPLKSIQKGKRGNYGGNRKKK